MRQLVIASLVLAGALPLGAQERTLDAGFSRTAYAEPTFFVSRAAYVAVFELVGGDRVVQRYPRVEAQAATALPAGETTLAWLDVNLGRIADAPGTRTVFYRSGMAASSGGFPTRAPTARTMLLIASTQRLKVGASVDFLARFRDALDRQPAGRDVQDRALAAVVDVVRPDDAAAELVTSLETMWVVAFPEFRGAALSAYANESYGYGSACDAIAPFGYAAYATWTNTVGCPDPYVGYFPGGVFFFLPRLPFPHGPYADVPRDPRPTGPVPGTPVPPRGSPGVHRAKPLTTETMPAVAVPVQTHGGFVFAGPAVDHRPIDGGAGGAARREAAPPVARPLGPEPVISAPVRAEPQRGEPAHAEPPRYQHQPATRTTEPVRREPERYEPVARPAEAPRPAPQPILVAPAPTRAPVAAPASHEGAPSRAPAVRPSAAPAGAQPPTKRN